LSLKARLRRLERHLGIKPEAPPDGLRRLLLKHGIEADPGAWLASFLDRAGFLPADPYCDLDDDGRDIEGPHLPRPDLDPDVVLEAIHEELHGYRQ
jgi:hypothetical protein